MKESSLLAVGSLFLCDLLKAGNLAKKNDVGVQLYSVRKEMLEDAAGTLIKLANIGYKEIESAKSEKGNYYGLKPKEIKQIVSDHGMTLRSGHTHIDNDWQQSIDEAAEASQQYLICATLPSSGQTVANYQKNAELFNKAGEQCKKAGITFGYHNHKEEFDEENGQVLYDVLLNHVQPNLVTMEMDLGWIIAAGKDPLDYFKKYPGRFPLWHLKDMDLKAQHSVEFGKGSVSIAAMFQYAKKAGLKYYFVEQEEYAHTALESLAYDYDYLAKYEIKL
ncbi:MAG: sugar phosphate isomerase/epimerase [Bacteroidota bacterium]|nr:sugar phosphate isomerase/epimerase [Bacteroidota bacterium]